MLNCMTEPQYTGNEGNSPYPPPGDQPLYQPQKFYPPPGQYPQGAYPQGPYPPGAYYDPSAPYGRHPVTGEPYSDKSKIIAGLLQLVGLFGFVGFGRIYIGDVGLGVAQLVVGLVTCFFGAWIWGVIDAILILTDKVRDSDGRPLRDGT
jgi:TM2 domain-containing membrane protein YozV